MEINLRENYSSNPFLRAQFTKINLRETKYILHFYLNIKYQPVSELAFCKRNILRKQNYIYPYIKHQYVRKTAVRERINFVHANKNLLEYSTPIGFRISFLPEIHFCT